MLYQISRIAEPFIIDARWDKPAWQKAEPLELSHFMGDRPLHFPRVQARLLYDPRSLHVAFHVEDRYVRAVAQSHQDAVFRDSCVEFFFTVGADVSQGYFNLEMNCGGTMLFYHQVVPRQDSVPIAPADLDRIEVAHTLSRIVEPEITEPVTWTVEYRLPLDLLSRYAPSVLMPASGVRWRANFYKCADGTSHPHWLTWAPVGHHKPDFHRPQFFGMLEFQ